MVSLSGAGQGAHRHRRGDQTSLNLHGKPMSDDAQASSRRGWRVAYSTLLSLGFVDEDQSSNAKSHELMDTALEDPINRSCARIACCDRVVWLGLAALAVAVSWAYGFFSSTQWTSNGHCVRLDGVGMNFCVAVPGWLRRVRRSLARALGCKHLVTVSVWRCWLFWCAGSRRKRTVSSMTSISICRSVKRSRTRAASIELRQSRIRGFRGLQCRGEQTADRAPLCAVMGFRLFGATESVAEATVRAAVAITVALLYFALVLAHGLRREPIGGGLCYTFSR